MSNNDPNNGGFNPQQQQQQQPVGYTVTPAQTVTISFSALKWVVGGIIFLCIQGFTLWNLIDNKFIAFEGIVDRVEIIEKIAKDNEKGLSDKNIYIEKAKNLIDRVNDLEDRVNDQSNYQEKNYDQISSMRRDFRELREELKDYKESLTGKNK